MNGYAARVGATCGILFPVGLFVGSNGYGMRGIGLAAIVLALPFFAYLYSLLREAEGPGGWLAPTALACGLAGITVKLASVGPEFVIHRLDVADGTQLHDVLQGIADGTTDFCLYPLALMAAAVCVVAVRTRVLPRWLGYGAGVTAVALAVNATINLYSKGGFIPAFLLFLLWTLLAGIVLLRRGQEAPRWMARTVSTVSASPADLSGR
jgi:hypothetical protein